MIRNIFWDIDGTLLDFSKSENAAIKSALGTAGIPFTEEDAERYSVINDNRWKRFERGEIDRTEVCVGRFSELFEVMGVTGTDPEAFHEIYRKALADTYFFVDGSPEILDRLNRKGIRQFAVTNGNTFVQERKLRLSGLDKRFEEVFISEKIGSRKPLSEFFDLIFAALPDVKRDESIIVGDSLSSDILGGNNASIIAVWYNPKGEKNGGTARPDYEIASLDDLDALLESVK